MRKNLLFILTTIVAFALFIPNAMAIEVKTEDEFLTNVKSGQSVEIKKDLTITLTEDITLTKKLTIGTGSGNVVSVTIDLNGHALKTNGSSAQIYVQTKGKLIVNDSVGTGIITNAGATGYNPYMLQVGGALEVNGGTIENTLSSNQAVYIQLATSTGVLNGGTIINSYTKGSKAVSSTGTFTINGGKVISKAAGTTGQTTAIAGKKVIMNGGTVEGAGTAIEVSGAPVEINGGTIIGGTFALHTNYAVINPAEGKEVNIKAGRAAVIAYNAPAEGQGNVIYGGNFDAPTLMETAYVCDSTNMEVHGGVFTSDVSEYVVDGKYAEKVGDVYEIKEYTQNVEVTPIDPTDEVEDTTVGLTPDEETEDTLMESLDKEIAADPELQEAVQNNHVVVVVDVTAKEENAIDDELVEKFENVAENIVIADYFDISVLVHDANDNHLGTIKELTKEIELAILLPEKYINKDANVNRKYYVIREHLGEVKILEDVVVSEDGKSIIFKSNKFSTYALAYTDEVIEDTPTDDFPAEVPSPDTSDINLTSYIVTLLLSTVGVVITFKKRFVK